MDDMEEMFSEIFNILMTGRRNAIGFENAGIARAIYDAALAYVMVEKAKLILTSDTQKGG